MRHLTKDTPAWHVTDCAKRYLRRYMGKADFYEDQETNQLLRHMVQFGRVLLRREERFRTQGRR